MDIVQKLQVRHLHSALMMMMTTTTTGSFAFTLIWIYFNLFPHRHSIWQIARCWRGGRRLTEKLSSCSLICDRLLQICLKH